MNSRRIVLMVVLVAWSLCTWIMGTLLAALLFMPWGHEESADFPLFLELLWHWFNEPMYWIHSCILVPVMIGTQVLFLLPILPVRMSVGKSRSLRASLVLGGLGAAMLTSGLVLGLVSFVQLLGGWIDDMDLALYSGLDGLAVLEPKMYAYPGFLVPLIFLLVSWILWSLVLMRFMRRGQPIDRIGRLTGLLLAGTLIEIILLIPLEAMVRRRADCYCATGSFQALIGGVAAALWLLGPMAFLVLLRRRPAWWTRHCQQCGYEKGPGATGHCPECGSAWGRDSAPV